MAKKLVKICICTFHNSIDANVVGGVTTGPIYLRDMLSEYFEQVDVVSLRIVTKNTDKMFENVLSTHDISVLNRYDFVIFMCPGLTYEKFDESIKDTAYMYMLNHMDCPFAFIVNEENDRKLYPYYMNFLTHKNMKLVIFNSENMNETFQDFLEICPNYLIFNFTPPLKPLEEILAKADTKENVITSTARWTDRKRILELANISKEFYDKGFTVNIAGAHQSPFYMIKMKEAYSDYWNDLGYYQPSELPKILENAAFHYNFVYLKRMTKNRIMVPRIEIATLEALNEGCLPVICADTTPDWVGTESAIRISSKEYDKLPEIVCSMSKEERIDRITNFYNLVKTHIHEYYYPRFSDKIMEILTSEKEGE